MSDEAPRHRVVVVGGGFGGLLALRLLGKEPVDVTVVDRRNHHLFQPLLYQVATGMLSPGQIAPPIRHVVRRSDNVSVVLAEVTGFDLDARVVHASAPGDLRPVELPYDSLIVAAGASQSYFGHDEFALHAPGMKTIDDALELRRRFFGAFEMAETATDPVERDRWLTIIVVGAGPTGVELAGQVRELATRSLRGEFRNVDPTAVRVLLLDGGKEPLATFGDRLSGKATKELERLGVELRMDSRVVGVDANGVDVVGKDGAHTRIDAYTTVWAAGVQASPLAAQLAEASGATLDRAGRIAVADDLTIPGHPEVFAIGDMATVHGLPGVAEVAMQGGLHAANTIARRLKGKEAVPFKYRDMGSVATIGRFRAIASVHKLRLSGFPGWVVWFFVHLAFLTGFGNRLQTMSRWLRSMIGRGRGEREFSTAHVGGDLSLPASVRAKSNPTCTQRRPKASAPTRSEPGSEVIMVDHKTNSSGDAQSAAMPSPFTPIAEYAFLSDCHTGALVAPDGGIDWLCVPRFDAPSVFAALLDRGAGTFRLGPFGINVPSARRYEPGTNVLETTWKTPSGWVRVRDALIMGPTRGPDTVTPHTRPPADDDARHMLVRTAECLDGRVAMELVCEPGFAYGRIVGEWSLVDGTNHAADAVGADVTIRLRTDMSLGVEAHRVRARHLLRAGERLYCALSWDADLAAPEDEEEANELISATAVYWRSWLDQARIPDHRWMQPIQRSALAIKGLTYMPTGATVAALTTSLPESPGGERNWDYRYTWMRDSTFTLQALHWLGLDWEADEFMQFVADLEANDDGALQIMYGIDGRRDLTESTLDHLSGYVGARPVRVGNGAFDQRQNDVYGAVLDAIHLHTVRSQRLPRRLWPIVEAQARCATAVWGQPDQGIWEARGAPQHYVSSKLMGWVALDRAAKLAELRGAGDLRDGWRATAEEIRADILAHGVSDKGVLRQHYETDALDASTLLAPMFGFLSGDDERARNTVLAIAEDLTENGFVLRYRTDETDDGLSGKEGTFLICSFWLVSALSIVGEHDQARDLMERLLRVTSPLGLYAEEFDVDTGYHLGNFPQAFSHLALIEAAGRIIATERLEELRG